MIKRQIKEGMADRILWLISIAIPYFGIRIVEWYLIRKTTKEMIPMIMIGVITNITKKVLSPSTSNEERE